MKKQGQIITHAALTLGGIIAAALTTYYVNQQNLEGQIADVRVSTSSSIASINASVASLQTDSQNLTNALITVNNNLIQIGEFAGVKHLEDNIAN